MSDIVEMLRQLIRAELSKQVVSSHIGVLEKVNPHADGDKENYGFDVKLRGRDVVFKGVPMVTDHLGTVCTPEEGDLVLLHFVEGDPDHPVIGGRLYSDALRPPPYDAGQIITQLPPSAGETDRVDIEIKGGKSGERTWTLKLPSDVEIAVTDKKVAVKVGKMTLTIDGEGGEMTLKGTSCTVTAKDGGDVTVEGTNVKIDAKANVEIKAGGQLKLNATGTAELKGAMVNIN